MKQRTNGLTIVEILVAVTIIALLAAGLYSVGGYLETQSKIKLTRATIETLSAAVEQYHDFKGSFPFQAGTDYGQTQLESTDTNSLNGNVKNKNDCTGTVSDYNDIYASSEALYYFLNQIPPSKKILDSINRSLLTNKGDKNKEYFINIGGQCYLLIHILDAWNYPLRYTYKNKDNFPVIESAGPDKDFGDSNPVKAKDNISSRK